MENSDHKNFILNNSKILNQNLANQTGEIVILDDDDFIQTTLNLFSTSEINYQQEPIDDHCSSNNLLEQSIDFIDLTSKDDFDLYDIFMLDTEPNYNVELQLSENLNLKKELSLVVKTEYDLKNLNNLKEFPENLSNDGAKIGNHFSQDNNFVSSTCSKDKQLICPDCLKPFKKSYNYKRHLLLHKNKDTHNLEINKCPNCKREITDRSNFIKHLKICSPDNIENFKNLKKIKSCSPKEFNCLICEKIFTKKYNLTRHLGVHLINELNRNNEFADNLNYRSINESLKIELYECEKCQRRFSTKQLLLFHKDKWHGTKYSCEYCEEGIFYEKLEFIRHLNLNHKIKFNFECKFCKKSFRFVSQFIQHRLTHLKNFQINQWDKINKTFDTEFFNLNKNISKITQCTFCGKNFSKKFNLNRHIKKKHSTGNNDHINRIFSQKQNEFFEQNKSSFSIKKL